MDSLRSDIAEILAAMPVQSVRDAGPVEWGPEGNKARAVYAAARLGHQFDVTCRSCESDLYFVLRNAVKP